jgi:hypothetical protein
MCLTKFLDQLYITAAFQISHASETGIQFDTKGCASLLKTKLSVNFETECKNHEVYQ